MIKAFAAIVLGLAATTISLAAGADEFPVAPSTLADVLRERASVLD